MMEDDAINELEDDLDAFRRILALYHKEEGALFDLPVVRLLSWLYSMIANDLTARAELYEATDD